MTRRSLLLLAVWLAAVLLPTNEGTWFDGLPLDSAPQLLLGAVAALVVVNRDARGALSGFLRRTGRVGWWAAMLVGIAVIVAKSILLMGSPPVGFRGCYDSVFPETRSQDISVSRPDCGRSYENLFNREGVTRFDDAIDFGPSDREALTIQDTNWNLSFLNARRYNTWQEGQTDRSRPPLHARWSGTIETTSDRVAVEYVGEGRLEIGDRSTQLESSYAGIRRVALPVQTGRQNFVLDFAFDDGSAIGEDAPSGQFAQVRVTEYMGPGDEKLLRPVGPGSGMRALGIFSDASMVGLVLVMAAALALALVGAGRVVALLAGLAIAAWALDRGGLGFAPSVLPVSPVILALFVGFVLLLYLAPDKLASLGIPSALVASAYLVLAGGGGLQAVLYRGGGDDWLTYQGFAHRVLETGSLQGGEDVFYYQPGFRYLVFAGHALVGDGDRIPFVLGVLGLTGAVFLVGWWLMSPVTGRAARLVMAVGGVGLLALATTAPILYLVELGSSEYPTWALLVVALPLLFTRDSTSWTIAGSAALGACAVIRPNQVVGVAFLMAIFVAVFARRSPRRVAACVLVFGALLLLPAVHNLYYGHELVFRPTGAGTVYDLPVRDLSQIFTDAGTRQTFRQKIAGMLYLSDRPPREAMLGLSLLALQASWVVVLVRMFLRRRTVPWFGWCIVLWPFAFAIPHVFYDIWIYYPRHVIATNLAMGSSAVFIEARLLSCPEDGHDEHLPGSVDLLNAPGSRPRSGARGLAPGDRRP